MMDEDVAVWHAQKEAICLEFLVEFESWIQASGKRGMAHARQFSTADWQKRQAEIFERDGWRCKSCGQARSML